MPLPEVHNKTTKINGLTIQQHFLEQVGLSHGVKPFIADRMWNDQQSSHRELSFLSACKIFLAVELLLWVKVLYSRTAARTQSNYRGSGPHSRMTHHEGVVSLTIRSLLSSVTSHFCKRLSISLPCCKNGAAQTWLAYIPAGIVYVLRSHMQMCNLFVRSCSHMNCLMQKIPDVNGRSAASAAVFKLILFKLIHSMSVTNHAQIFDGVCVGELRPIF